MKFQLIVTAGRDKGQTFSLSSGDAIVVGRGQTAQFRMNDACVSRQHCSIEVGEHDALIENLSTSGTFVNGDEIGTRVGQKDDLQPGAVIRIGESELRFEVDETADAQPAAPVGATGTHPLAELIGQQIHNYRVDSELAQGTSGAIFKCWDVDKERDLAMKVLWPEVSKDEEEMQRFLRAMKTMFPIRHPNIVRIYNAGKTGKHVWVALEYVEGEDLTKVIERIGTAGMLDWQYAFRLAVQIARALEAAFEHQIIHRNITPKNILIRRSDKVAKLGDMMLAKALESTKGEQITKPGQLVGDIVYMPPERTGADKEVDCRADIYSLGATVYTLLTGRPPFEGNSLPQLISKIRNDEPVTPKEFQLSIFDMFEGIVLRMLAKRPEDRFQTPSKLLEDLERVARFQNIDV